MLNALFWILVGAMIGWQVEQPAWAKMLHAKVKEITMSLIAKAKAAKAAKTEEKVEETKE